MRKERETFANPYATNAGGKIEALAKKKSEPKSSVITPNAKK